MKLTNLSFEVTKNNINLCIRTMDTISYFLLIWQIIILILAIGFLVIILRSFYMLTKIYNKIVKAEDANN